VTGPSSVRGSVTRVLTADIPLSGLGRTGLLRQPDDGTPVRGGVVALHGASDPSRRQPLFDHLADTITPLGFAVLSYDRRESASGDVPLRLQADDALVAAGALTESVGAPVGVYAFSQGAWAACVAAADPRGPAFLALVGCSGVSPGEQMRYYTDQRLLRAGFDEDARRRQLEARAGMEEVFRGSGDRTATAAALSAIAREPWFDLVYLPPELPPPEATWDDLDFDPAGVIAKVSCPTLLVYGADEECVPAGPSIDVWRTHGARELTVASLPGCGHYPAVGSADQPPESLGDVSPDYTRAVHAWFADL